MYNCSSATFSADLYREDFPYLRSSILYITCLVGLSVMQTETLAMGSESFTPIYHYFAIV